MLWDESHLWGVMLWRALKDLNIPFTIIDSGLIKEGILQKNPPAGLLVPGGWSRLKSDNLGRKGLSMIREYIFSGGRYLGICGGAGLGLRSTSESPYLDFCSWTRKTIQVRLPNFSGHLRCRVALPGWSRSRTDIFLPVWWPAQFEYHAEKPGQVDVLATYLEPGSDFWTADLPFSDLNNMDLSRWEGIYGINLDPDLLAEEPCIIHGRLGSGEYVLSYSHLETPGSVQANRLLAELLYNWMNRELPEEGMHKVFDWDLRAPDPVWDEDSLLAARQGLEEIIELGRIHFLLYWRTPWLLGWRRGVPGGALNFLYAMISFALHQQPNEQALLYWKNKKREFKQDAVLFQMRLKDYMTKERLALALAPSSPESSSDLDLQKEKLELFGRFPGYGGLYARLIRPLDRLLFLMGP